MDELVEIENEDTKFSTYVEDILICGPNKAHPCYIWGNYAGLEYDLNWSQASLDHLSLEELYRECVYESTESSVTTDYFTGIITKLFGELYVSWWCPDKDNQEQNRKDKPPAIRSVEDIQLRNIYEEHYPFTKKIEKEGIVSKVNEYFAWGKKNWHLNASIWDEYYQELIRLLDIGAWRRRKSLKGRYDRRVARAIIHGDLNSRNILLEVDPHNHCQSQTIIIRLIDFSHTGNGLTIEKFKQVKAEGIKLDEDKGHIANDFCRLEADIKFYLTDLNDEQDLRKAWILECLLLEKGLQLPDWSELQNNNEFDTILRKYNLSNDPEWAGLSDYNCWTEENSKKFIWAWQSIKAVRGYLLALIKRDDKDSPELDPFYLALLQASLSLIYYEDDRFHNAHLQKLYMVLAAALLCNELH